MNARSNAPSIAQACANGQCTYVRTNGRTYADAYSPREEISPYVTHARTYGGFING